MFCWIELASFPLTRAQSVALQSDCEIRKLFLIRIRILRFSGYPKIVKNLTELLLKQGVLVNSIKMHDVLFEEHYIIFFEKNLEIMRIVRIFAARNKN